MRALLVALLIVIVLPSTFSFKPRPQPPYERPLSARPTGPTHAEREIQVQVARPAGLLLGHPRTDLVWDGPDLLFTTPEGRFRATFSDFPHQAQTVTREPTDTYTGREKKTPPRPTNEGSIEP